ncbi:MAG: hypothetical protein ACI4UC_02070 [Alloprevotella sp.]
MRKYLLLIFVLCACCRMAWAQGVSFADLDEGKYYYMKSGKNYVAGSSWFRGYIVMQSGGTNLTLQGVINPTSPWTVTAYQTEFNESTAGKEAMWGVVKYTDINGTTYAIIYNAKNGKCFKSTAATSSDLAVMALAEEVGYYKFEAMSGANIAANSYRIRNVSTHNANYMLALAPGQTTSSNKCVSAYSGSATDGGVPICFVEVPSSNPNGTFDPNIRKLVDIRDAYGNARTAYNLMTEMGTYGGVSQFNALGTSLNTFRSAPTVANASTLQTAYSALVPVHCGNGFSYEIYHYKYGLDQGRGMLAYDNSRTNPRPATVGVTYTDYTTKGYKNPCDDGVSTRWGIYKDAAGNRYLYNEDNAARLLSPGDPSTWSETPVAIALDVNNTPANTTAIKPAGSTSSALGISLGYLDANNDKGDIRTQALSDDGNKLIVRIVGAADADAQSIVEAMLRRVEYPVDGCGYVGGLPTRAVVTGENRTVANARAILDAEPTAIEAGKHYRIISNLRNKAISTVSVSANTDGELVAGDANCPRVVYTKTYTDEDLSSICQFQETEPGLYNIYMDNAGLCLGAFNSGTCEIPIRDYQTTANLPVVSLVAQNGLAKHIWTIHVGSEASTDTYLNAWEGVNPEGLGTYNLGSPVGDGNKWKIQLVESVPVTLSSAGWSTKCFPFAVNIPEGIKAYYATSIQSTAIYVKEFSDVIPAGAPVLLQGEVNHTYNFVINTTDATVNPADNILTGTTLRRYGYASGDVYGLKVTGASAAFVPASTAAVPANKSVLNADLVPATPEGTVAKELCLSFDEVTGIDGNAVITDAADEAVYDLSGRRVQTLRRGVVYIKANGQKFLLK